MSDNPCNSHEQVGHGGIYIIYHPAVSRSVMPNKAAVIRVGFKTNPKGAWYDHGNKSFIGKMRESVPLAKAWAEERYGIKQWKRNGMGDWIDADAGFSLLRCEVERKKKRAANAEAVAEAMRK